MKKKIFFASVCLLAFLGVGYQVNATEINVDSKTEIYNSDLGSVTPFIWASHVETQVRRYNSFSAIPTSIYYENNFGQNGTLYLINASRDSSSGRWIATFRVTISGHI